MAGISISLRGNFAKLDELKSKSAKTAAGIKQAFAGVGKALSFVGVAVGATAAFGAIAAGAKAAVKAASDLGETVSKTDAVFKKSSAEVQTWAASASRSFGQSKQQALDAASGFGSLFVSMGIGESKAADMSMRITELASDLASFNNASVDDAITAIGAGLRGEAEPMRRFRVLMDDATLKAQAFAEGIWNGKGNLDQTTKAMAAYSLILAKTTTAHGDYQRTGDGLANSQRTISALIADLSADIGQELLPVVVRMAAEMKSWDFQAIGEAIGGVTGFVLDLASAFGGAIEKGMELVGIMSLIEKAAGDAKPTKGTALPGYNMDTMLPVGSDAQPQAKPPQGKTQKEAEADAEIKKTQAAVEQFNLESQILAARTKGDKARLESLEREMKIREEMKRLETAGIPKEAIRSWAESRISDEEKADAAEKTKDQLAAVKDYNLESAILTAKMRGDDASLQKLEREKRIREEMQKLMSAGFSEKETRLPAEKKVDAEIAIEKRDEKKEDLEDKLKENESKQKGLQFDSTIGAIHSMQRVGGGGGAVSSGLDYARQSADLQREANDLLRQLITVSRPIEF